MKRSVSLLSNLLVSSTLFWGVPMAYGEELGSGQVVRVPATDASYCHMKFPPIREDTLSWSRPVLDDSSTAFIDFYGPCDHDPLGNDEIKAQRRLKFGGTYGDSE
jgi:hypothetical protein